MFSRNYSYFVAKRLTSRHFGKQSWLTYSNNRKSKIENGLSAELAAADLVCGQTVYLVLSQQYMSSNCNGNRMYWHLIGNIRLHYISSFKILVTLKAKWRSHNFLLFFTSLAMNIYWKVRTKELVTVAITFW